MDKTHLSRRSKERYNKRQRLRSSNFKPQNHLSTASLKIGSRKKIRYRFKKNKYEFSKSTIVKSSLKIGAINVNGLNLENCGEIEEILNERDFDVS